MLVTEQQYQEQPGIAFDITDNGVGFPKDLLESAAEPFVTSQPAARSGLGLSVVSGFARMHGGSFSILSTGETGTTVRLWLPADSAPFYEL